MTPAPVSVAAGKAGLRLHIVSTQNTFVPMSYDIFDARTGTVVANGKGADESRQEQPMVHELAPGVYKIVRAGEAFASKVDFANVELSADKVTDYVIVVDADSLNFRGTGVVTTELPTGVHIAGIRLALNAGGTLMLNQKANPIGTTSGTTALVGLFGNFGLVLDKGPHFLIVSSELQLQLTDPVRGSMFSTTDRFEASALYAYNLNNKYIGPYVRGGFHTSIFPGYLYLESNSTTTGTVNITHKDGSVETRTFGTEADQDNLRIRLSDSFAPFILQEEIGANLKAISLDLLLLKLTVGTRLGFAFRQGITNGLLVVQGTDTGPTVNLREVDDYSTLGPVIGATANVTFARWLFGAASFGMIIPVVDSDRGDFADRLLIDFSGTAGLKVPILTNLLTASFDYTFRLQRDFYLTNDTQFEHQLMARVNITLF